MRYGIVAAAALTAALAAALSSTSARADGEWCGYGAGNKTQIECGYSSVAQCQSVVGKDGVCFVDPEYGLQAKRPAVQPVNFTPAG